MNPSIYLLADKAKSLYKYNFKVPIQESHRKECIHFLDLKKSSKIGECTATDIGFN